MKNFLLVITATTLCCCSCEREKIPFLISYDWEGTWLAKEVALEDSLQLIPPPALGVYMRFIIPDTISGNMGLVTFSNSGRFDFNRFPGNKVKFGTFGGTRAGEDKWGSAIKTNIRKTDNFQVEGDRLYFKDIDDRILIVLDRE